MKLEKNVSYELSCTREQLREVLKLMKPIRDFDDIERKCRLARSILKQNGLSDDEITEILENPRIYWDFTDYDEQLCTVTFRYSDSEFRG